MSRNMWAVGAVAVILAAGVWWYMGMPGLGGQELTPSQALEKNPPAPRTDTSDQALSQDQAAIDAQINGFASDQGAINSSLSDQPIEQSY